MFHQIVQCRLLTNSLCAGNFHGYIWRAATRRNLGAEVDVSRCQGEVLFNVEEAALHLLVILCGDT